MNNKLVILRERFKKLSCKIFKKTFSKKELDNCITNIKVGKSGDKVSFEFTPENTTTYNASINTIYVLLIRLSNNHELILPPLKYIKKNYYELYPNTKGFREKKLHDNIIEKKTRGRSRKIEKSENTHITVPHVTVPHVTVPQEQQSTIITNDNVVTSNNWTMALNLIKELTNANATSKDNEIKYLKSVIATSNTFANAAFMANTAVDNPQITHAAQTLLNLANNS